MRRSHHRQQVAEAEPLPFRSLPVRRALPRQNGSDSQPQRILICRVAEEQIGFEVDDVTSIIPYSRDKVLPIPVLAEHRASVFHGCFTDRHGVDFVVLNEQGSLSRSEIMETVQGFRRLSEEQTVTDARKAAPTVKVITFRMGKLYALRLHEVMEVLACPKELIRAPRMPEAVLGVMNLRGTPISVLDPRKLFDLAPAEPEVNPALLVFQHENRRVAIRVDSVESIVPLSTAANEQLPPVLFRDEKPKLNGSFERGAETISRGVRTALIVLSADEIVAKLIAALEG
jgi:purine-binding chemotaxis protein CheW